MGYCLYFGVVCPYPEGDQDCGHCDFEQLGISLKEDYDDEDE